MYVRHILDDFVVSARSNIASAELHSGVMMKIEPLFHGQISGSHRNLDHVTGVSSVLFGGISFSFLPYSERQNTVVNHYILF